MVELLPESLSLSASIALIAISFVASGLTAAIGIGGGTLMLASMAQILPAVAIIPLHGVVQLGSNAGRAAVFAKHLNLHLVSSFVTGAILGVLFGGSIVVALPDSVIKVVLACFILASVWLPALRTVKLGLRGLFLGGILTSALTMFVGATGPMVISLLRSFKQSPIELVANNALCLLCQHTLKVLVFGLLGFTFQPYIGLLFFMIIAGFAGTLIGKQILLKRADSEFTWLLNVVLTIMAIRLLLSA